MHYIWFVRTIENTFVISNPSALAKHKSWDPSFDPSTSCSMACWSIPSNWRHGPVSSRAFNPRLATFWIMKPQLQTIAITNPQCSIYGFREFGRIPQFHSPHMLPAAHEYYFKNLFTQNPENQCHARPNALANGYVEKRLAHRFKHTLHTSLRTHIDFSSHVTRIRIIRHKKTVHRK